MVEDIREEFNVELTVADFINNKTVGAMAEHIETLMN
jgi:acyl carrier protein